MTQFSTKRLLAAVLMIGIGVVCIAILCRPGYDLRSTVTPFIVAAIAGAWICTGLAFLLRWSIVYQVAFAVFGALVAAFILLVVLFETFDGLMP